MIAKILVAHDGTEISNRAFERATEFAKAFNQKLEIIGPTMSTDCISFKKSHKR